MEKKSSKKNNSQQNGDHHFIPQVYIQRFYDEKINKVWRGKLQYKETKRFTSKQIFYVPKLYDLKLLGEEFTEIEGNYSKLEDQLAKIYKLLDETDNLNIIKNEKEVIKNLFLFIKIVILTQYFRTDDMHPAIFRERCQNLVKTYESKDISFKKEFEFIKIEELRMIEKLIKKGIKKNRKYTNELIKGLQHSVLPLLLSNLNGGKLKIIRQKSKKYISSDKPVVCKNINDILNLQNFIYPLTPNILVYSLGEDVTEDMIQDENKVNDFIYNNSISYIISHDEDKIKNYMKKL